MEIRLSIADPARAGACVDLAVSAERGTPLSAVRDEVLAAAGAHPDAGPLCCDGVVLDPAAPLGVLPLVQGALLTVGDAGIAAGAAAGTSTAALELHVVSGPGAGTIVPLPPGGWQIGRSSQAVLRLDDPDVSRLHAELRVGAGTARLHDLGSTNGTAVDGAPVSLNPGIEVREGQRIVIGRCALMLRGPSGVPAACSPDGEGHRLVNRAPRLHSARHRSWVRYPPDPPPPRRSRLPWPAMLLPLLAAVAAAVLWHQPAMLLLGLLSPLLLGAQFVTDRRQGHRDAAGVQRRHRAAIERAEAALSSALAAELAALEGIHPDLAMLGRIATCPTDRLWERSLSDPDALLVRIGRGRVRSGVRVHRVEEPLSGADDTGSPGAGQPVEHDDAPVTLDLRTLAVVGVCGPREQTLALTGALLAQLAVLHSPREVRIAVDAGSANATAWAWTSWLPHYRAAVDGPRAGGPLLQPGHLVVVVDGTDRSRRSPRVADLLATGAAGTVTVIWLDAGTALLPVECAATVTVCADGAASLRRRSQAGSEPLGADLAGPGWVQRVARSLAPLRDDAPAGSGGLPTTVRLPPLLSRYHGADPLDADEVVRLWRDGGRCTVAVLGVDGDGPYAVDLGRDGPHALVAGTTGAGKSELLQCLVASLAVANRPDELAFVLIDYKGGAAFAECARLPHVSGLVTDLDSHLTRRALTSLAAELRRRETLLRSAGVTDVDAYAERCGARDGPKLARLVIVVDEFRVLAEELPDFVTGLVRIAAVGRSLGVHLVLATQRPAGIVSADIRANVNLRVALRVRDRQDSVDVVDAATAAELGSDVPGRALARCGAGKLVRWQVARVTGPPRSRLSPGVRRLAAAGASGDPSEPSTDVAPAGPNDLSLLVAAARTAAARLSLPDAVPPWLPPLPDRVLLADLPAAPTAAAAMVPFGLADHPSQQRQAPIGWQLGAGSHCAIVGGPRSGRTGMLRALAASAASRFGRTELHLHAIGSGNELDALQRLPHVGTVAPARDARRVLRLLARLEEEITDRRQASNSGPVPLLMLLVDGWEHLLEATAGVEHGRAADDLLRILRAGAAAGVLVAITGGRGLLTGPAGALLGERIVLRMSDPVDAALAGVPSGRLPERMPPGRAVRLGGDDPAGTELQVATLADDPTPHAQNAALAALGHALTAREPVQSSARPPWRIRELPVRLHRHQLVRSRGERHVPVGVGGDELATLGLDLQRHRGVLVLGSPGSGRSSALATIGLGLLELGTQPLVIASALSAAARLRLRGARVLDPLEAGTALHLQGLAAPDVLVDDAACLPPELEEVLLARAVRAAAGHGGSVVAVAEPAHAATAYRGLLPQLRRQRIGLLLGPVGSGDGEAFSLRLAPSSGQPAGRGLLVSGGRAVAVQVAEPGLADGQELVQQAAGW